MSDDRCAYFRWKGEHDWKLIGHPRDIKQGGQRLCRICKLKEPRHRLPEMGNEDGRTA